MKKSSYIANDKLISNLLTSDLIFVKSSFKKISQTQKESAIFKTKQKTVLLNSLVLLQSFKQFIRLVQFNKRANNFSMQLVLTNKLFSNIAQIVLQNYSDLKDDIFITNKLNIYKNSKIVLAVNDDTNERVKNLTYKSVSNRIYTILLINLLKEKNFFGNYKIYTELNNFKKLIFLLLVIQIAQK